MDIIFDLLDFAAGHRLAFLIYLAAVNLLTFLLFGLDKRRAKLKAWRIPESWLILFVLIGGSLGGLLGMQLFRHKTQHTKFVLTVPLALALHALLAAAVVYRVL